MISRHHVDLDPALRDPGPGSVGILRIPVAAFLGAEEEYPVGAGPGDVGEHGAVVGAQDGPCLHSFTDKVDT